jgi:UDP-glucose 4-epimerase
VKTVVTGGSGFIGSHVVDLLLANGHDITVINNYSAGRRANLDHVTGRVSLEEVDIAMPGPWVRQLEGSDWVIHLAALADIVPSIENPDGYFRANVDGTFNVLEACHVAGIKRFVYAASSSCYGLPDVTPTPENADIRPQYPYAPTKHLGEELVLHWAQLYDFPALSLRLFNVYGPRSRTSGTCGAVFGVFLAQKPAGKPYTVVGDGTQTRDFTYVTDVARAFYAAAASDRMGEIFNISSGETVRIPKRPGEPDVTFADIVRVTRDLDWAPQVPIEEGVAQLLEHIDYWREAPVWKPDTIVDATQGWFKYFGKS